jgi:probable F420-dependent oxidoreductase
MRFLFMPPTRAVKHWPTWIGELSIAEVAVAVERAGFTGICFTDHPYPHGEWLAQGGHHSFDPLVAASFAAAATTRLRVMTNALVVGYRNPYLTAKATATLDLLCEGRLVLGLVAGYQRDEFAALGADFDHRGALFDEAVSALRRAWSGRPDDRDTGAFPAPGHVMLPAPAQRPGPPIWIGGNSGPALRRAARIGDGWIPFSQSAASAAVTRTPEMADLDELAAAIGRFHAQRREAGREGEAAVCFVRSTHPGFDVSDDDFVGHLGGYDAAGVTDLVVEGRARSAEACLREIAEWGDRLGLTAGR